MLLNESSHNSTYYLDILAKYYRSLGLHVKIERDPHPALSICDDKEHDYAYQWDDHTGMFFYFFDTDGQYLININTIVIEKSKRGTGLAGKMIDGLITIMGDDIYAIRLCPEAPEFWDYMKKKYSHIKWIFEDY